MPTDMDTETVAREGLASVVEAGVAPALLKQLAAQEEPVDLII